MKSRAAVYTILAIALGYILISFVPNQLTSSKTMILSDSSENQKYELDSKVERENLEIALNNGLWNLGETLFTWTFDLILSLGIFFIVKRRIF